MYASWASSLSLGTVLLREFFCEFCESSSLLRALGIYVSIFGVVGICFCIGQDLPGILPVYWGFPGFILFVLNTYCSCLHKKKIQFHGSG